jgi:hypothetical protein
MVKGKSVALLFCQTSYDQKIIRSSCKELFILSDFNETWIFLSDFRQEIFPKTNFMNIRLVGAEFVSCGQTDRWMDGHHESNSRFPQFCERATENDHGSTLSPPHAHTPCTRITAPWHCSTSEQQQRTLREGRPAVVSCSVTQLCGRQDAARGTFREIFIEDNCLVFSAFSLTETNLNSFITIHKQT